jgi:glycosyltransferase involved in cell wall biosynthesis
MPAGDMADRAQGAQPGGESLDVLHVLEATLGGTRQYLDDLARAARSLPLRMGLVYSTERADEAFTGTPERLRAAGWRTVELPMCRAVKPLRDCRAALQLRRLLAGVRPRLLHLHSSKAGGVGRLAAATTRPRPAVIYSPHALAVNAARRYLAIERLLARVTDRFAAISESERDEISRFGLASAARIDVVHPIIDAERYRPREREAARAELGLPPGPLVLGIGRFIEQKDPLGFLHAVERLRRRRPDATAIWIGAGDLAGAFERERGRLGLDGVVRVEPWKVDVRPWVAAADVLLSTARFESFGYVVAEALAMERPVVASRVTGTVDVVRGEARGLLYEPGDLEGAAERLEAVFAEPAAAASSARAGAREVRRTFSVEAMAERLRRLYAPRPGGV